MKLPARFPWLTLLGGAAALALGAAAPATNSVLEFSRAALGRGEIWRALTGHFTHFNADHLAWDVAAFLALGAFVEWTSRRAWLLTVLGGALVISAAVFVFAPQFETYRGLSGLGSALYLAAMCFALRRAHAAGSTAGRVLLGAGLLGFVAKVIFETVTGSTWFVAASPDFAPVPLAHLVGAALGALAVLKPFAPARHGHTIRDRASGRAAPSGIPVPFEPQEKCHPAGDTPPRRSALPAAPSRLPAESLSSGPRRAGGLRPGAISAPGTGAQIPSRSGPPRWPGLSRR